MYFTLSDHINMRQSNNKCSQCLRQLQVECARIDDLHFGSDEATILEIRYRGNDPSTKKEAAWTEKVREKYLLPEWK